MIRITDNLGNYAEADENGDSAEQSAGVAVTTLLADSPDCTTIVVTRMKTELELMEEMAEIMEETNKRTFGL